MKGISEYLAVMQTFPIRSEAEGKSMQRKPCSEGIPGTVRLAHRYRNAYCDGKAAVYIMKEPIEEGHGMCLDHKCYDYETLLEWLELKSILPHNQEPIKPKYVQWLMARLEPRVACQ